MISNFLLFYSNITHQTQYEHPCAAHYNMFGQQGQQSSPRQSVLHGTSGLSPASQPLQASTNATSTASAMSPIQRPSMISMLAPGGQAILPQALASGSLQPQITSATASTPMVQPVHTQFHPPHVLVPANPYLHEGMPFFWPFDLIVYKLKVDTFKGNFFSKSFMKITFFSNFSSIFPLNF